jgi:hypothetical protein
MVRLIDWREEDDRVYNTVRIQINTTIAHTTSQHASEADRNKAKRTPRAEASMSTGYTASS